jgi:hypothetical protein
MNETLMIKSTFIFMALWSIGIVMLWFRSRIEVVWKIIATVILAFYFWFFWTEISSGYNSFNADWFGFILNFLKELSALVFVNLFFIWPLALFIIFYKSDAVGAEKLLKFLCVLTLVLWVIFIVYFFFSKGIDHFLFQDLKKMVPDAQ